MNARLPVAAALLCVLGVVAFLALALAAMTANGAADARHLAWFIGAGALGLSFLGAVHWGLVLGAAQPERAGMRLGLGVLPAIAGWVALWLGIEGWPRISLALLIAAFLVTIAAERAASSKGWLPGGYLWLRYLLTLAVVLILATVLVLRLLGARIVL